MHSHSAPDESEVLPFIAQWSLLLPHLRSVFSSTPSRPDLVTTWNVQLSPDEFHLLNLGPKFIPRSDPATEAAEVIASASEVASADPSLDFLSTWQIITGQRLWLDNLSPSLRTALNSLRANPNIAILPDDRSPTFHVIHRTELHQAIRKAFADGMREDYLKRCTQTDAESAMRRASRLVRSGCPSARIRSDEIFPVPSVGATVKSQKVPSGASLVAAHSRTSQSVFSTRFQMAQHPACQSAPCDSFGFSLLMTHCAATPVDLLFLTSSEA